MAFKEVVRTFKKAKDIPVGQSLIGYVVGFYNSVKFPNLDNLEMKTESGDEFTLSVTGNLKYFKANKYPLGCLYRITRLDDKKNKMGTMSANFKVEYDTEKTVVVPTVVQVPVPPPAATDVTADKIPF